MARPVLAIRSLESQPHPARLKIPEIAARRDLQKLSHPRRPHLQVVTARRPEADVARAQLDLSVMQAELLQHRLRMATEGFQGLHGTVRVLDPDQLHLVELMHPGQTARLFPGAARLPPEAGRVGGILLGQIPFRQDFLPMQVGHWNLGRRHQEQLPALGRIHVLTELRQLPRPHHTRFPHQKRRGYLEVSVRGRVQVQHPVDQGPLQLRPQPAIDRKTAAGDLGRRREIKNPQFLAQRDVVDRLEIKFFGVPPCGNHRVVGGSCTLGTVLPR